MDLGIASIEQLTAVLEVIAAAAEASITVESESDYQTFVTVGLLDRAAGVE